ncbi:MAG: HNH endonuclease [Pseudomonadota bacterium]
MARRDWTEAERLVALKIYFELEFGQFDQRNQRVIEVSQYLGRTPSSLAMKLGNFASLDPGMDGKGLSGASKADAEIMARFLADTVNVLVEAEAAYDAYASKSDAPTETDIPKSTSGMDDHHRFFHHASDKTEAIGMRKNRVNQNFFRRAVLSGYNHQCGVCGLAIPDLLVASHIIPWSVDEKLRLRPDNGISLCSLHDKSFDLGYWCLTDDYSIQMGTELADLVDDEAGEPFFVRYHGRKLRLPFRFVPDLAHVIWHRKHIFRK